jgi:hypothetical protein
MRLKAIIKLANTFILSQERTSKRKYLMRFSRKPLMLLVTDCVAFISALIVTYILITTQFLGPNLDFFSSIVPQALASLPILTFFLMILIGSSGEITSSAQSASSEIVNWLPITALEYVLASATSVMYTYSILPATGLGVTFSLALKYNLLHVWLFSASLCILSTFISGLVIEMIRALTNKTFQNKIKGVSPISRLFITIIILITLQLLFNPIFLLPIIQGLFGVIESFWFIPIFWPSLMILEALKPNITGLLRAGLLNLIFFTSLLLLSVNLRRRYWVPTPVSGNNFNVSKSNLLEKILAKLNLSRIQKAFVRKDIWSLTRRKEMMRFFAVPVVLFLPMLLTLNITSGTEPYRSQPFELSIFAISILMIGLVTFTVMISITSIGQEGQAIWHIYLAPINVKDILKAKLSSVFILTLPTTFITLLLLTLFFQISLEIFPLFLLIALCLVIEGSFFGLAIGFSSPDFNEGPRNRFVRISENPSISLFSIISLVITGTPFILYLLFHIYLETAGFSLAIITAFTILLAMIFSWFSRRFSYKALETLFIERREY